MTRVGALFERASDGAWIGTCPSVPGAYAQGSTLRECRRRLRDAITTALLQAPSDELADLLDSEAIEAQAALIEIAVPEREQVELISQAEIARIAGVTRQAVANWVVRAGFPKPRGAAGARPRWRRDDVLRWLSLGRRIAGRPTIRSRWPAGAGERRRRTG